MPRASATSAKVIPLAANTNAPAKLLTVACACGKYGITAAPDSSKPIAVVICPYCASWNAFDAAAQRFAPLRDQDAPQAIRQYQGVMLVINAHAIRTRAVAQRAYTWN
jgi:hypothetical protein